MRFVAAIFLLFVAFPAAAFDSEKWLGERGDDSDMVRLREAYAECEKKIDTPAQNVTFPLETYPNGMVKSRLRAKKAFILAAVVHQ